jgi:hypothetical protein
MRIEFDIDTKLPPDRVVEALTDFSDTRPDVWPGLTRELYEVYSVGEHEAEVQEGTAKPIRVWAKEHYDWSTPGKVAWTVRESNFCTPGSGVAVTATRGPDGGSSVHVEWERHPSNARGRAALVMMALVGKKVLTTNFRKTFDEIADGKRP